METIIFDKLGFTKAETEIYIILLRIGSSTATRISEQTKLNRSHIYDSLKILKEKGLVSSYEMNKTLYFTASKPETIMDYIKEMEKELNEILPELTQLEKIEKPKAKVQLFQGKNGLKTILKDIIRDKKDYFVFGEEGQFQKIFPIYIEQFLRDVKYHRIKERLLSREDLKKKINITSNSQIRYLPKDFFSPATIVVYGNKIATFIWSEPYEVTLMEDKEVAESYRAYFESLWKIAKK